jgi:hypothetical protein
VSAKRLGLWSRSLSAPRNYDEFIADRSLRRQPSAIRALMPLLQIPGMISLGGGLPDSSTFPFASMSIGLKDGGSIDLSEADLAVALQYSATDGIPKLKAHMKGAGLPFLITASLPFYHRYRYPRQT